LWQKKDERREGSSGSSGRSRLAPRSDTAQQQDECGPEEDRDQDGRVTRVPEVYPRMTVRESCDRRVVRILLRKVRSEVRVVRLAGGVVGGAQEAVAGQERHQEQRRQDLSRHRFGKQGD
jgi:hypothetical protein